MKEVWALQDFAQLATWAPSFHEGKSSFSFSVLLRLESLQGT